MTGLNKFFFVAAALALAVCLPPQAFAQDKYLQGGQYSPFPAEPFAAIYPGIRLGAGGEIPLGPGIIALGLETGWTHAGFQGDAPDAELIPLIFRAGYGFLQGRCIFRLDALTSGFFLVGGETIFLPITGYRLGAEYLLGAADARQRWSVYAGTGADIILQSSGVVALSAIEAGVKLRLRQR
jgi:hypothetical protein